MKTQYSTTTKSSLVQKIIHLFYQPQFKFTLPEPASRIGACFHVILTWNAPLKPSTLVVMLDNQDVTYQFLLINYANKTTDTYLHTTPGMHTLSASGELQNVLPGFLGHRYQTQTTTISFNIQDFDFQLDPASLDLQEGLSKTVTVHLTRLGGLSEKVHFAASQNLHGITCTPLELKTGESSGALTVTAESTAQSTAVQITGNAQLDDGNCQHSRLIPVNVIPFPMGGGLGGGKPWRFGAECNQKSTNKGGFEYVTAYTKINYQPPDNPPANADDPFCLVAGEVHFAKIAPPLLWGNGQDNLRFVLQAVFPPGTKTADDAMFFWSIVPEDEVISNLTHALPFGSRPHYQNYLVDIPNPSAAEIWASLNVYITQDELLSTWIVPRNYKLVFAFPLVAATTPAPTSGNIKIYNQSMVGANLVPYIIPNLGESTLSWKVMYQGWCEACNALRVLTDNGHCSVCGSGNVRLPISPRIGEMPFSISTL